MDLKFPYLVLSAAGTWSLGFDAAREHATHNQSVLPLITAKRLGRYQSRRYDAAKSRNRRTEGLAGVVEPHFRTRYRDKGSLYNSFAYA